MTDQSLPATTTGEAVLHGLDLCDDRVVVDNPGGSLRATLENGSATLAGPVQFVANVEWLEA